MLSKEIIAFANGNTDLYEAAERYYRFENERTAENADKLTAAFFAEMEAKSGVARGNMDVTAWASHPSVRWSFYSIIDAVINTIIPVVILPQFGTFCDFRTVGYGDIVKFKVEPRGMFTVSRTADGQRTAFRQKKYARDVEIAPVSHIVTTYVDQLRVMAGKESLPEFLNLVLLSIQNAMYQDGLNALTTGIASAVYGDSVLAASGAFDMSKLLKMAEKVQALNGGAKPIITGSATALTNIDIPTGYRANTDAVGGAIEVLRSAYGFDIVKMDNAVNAAGNLVLPDDAIFVVSPSQDKILKGIMSSALTNSNDYYDNADLTQNFTYRKAWNFEYVTAAYAGYYSSIT